MFRTTKSTNSHFFVFQSFKNNGAIAGYPGTHCCFWRENQLDVSAGYACWEMLALESQGYINVNNVHDEAPPIRINMPHYNGSHDNIAYVCYIHVPVPINDWVLETWGNLYSVTQTAQWYNSEPKSTTGSQGIQAVSVSFLYWTCL